MVRVPVRASAALVLLLSLLGTSAGLPTVRAAAAPTDPTPFARGLEFPTNMAFAPDGRLFFTEKNTGNVRIVDGGELNPRPFVTLPVTPDAERGLLGVAIARDFDEEPWVYLYLSDAADGVNRLVRVRAEGDRGGRPETLLDGLDSAAGYHNGGDLVFAADGTLFASLGEAHESERAQDIDDLGGKIVHLNPDGSVPADNPFGPDNPVWSYGHRNSFGLCIDPATGELWETENGPDVDDEINLIRAGANYGWPQVTGNAGGAGLTRPVAVFADTIAVTGCAVVDGDVFIGSFDGRLWRLRADDRANGDVKQIASFPAGVTDVALGLDGLLYIATADSIWTMAPPGDENRTPSTGVTASPTRVGPSPTPAPTPGGGGGGSARNLIAAGAAVALAIGLGLRLAAGRRMRRAR